MLYFARMTEKTVGAALFGKAAPSENGKAPEAAPELPPQLLAMAQQVMQGGPPPPELLSALGPLMGAFGMPMDPLQQHQQERRDLAKALLLNLAHNEVHQPKMLAAIAFEQSEKLLEMLDAKDRMEKKGK